MIVSVDLGFGYTKAAGLTEWRQPSVIGEPRPLFDNTIRPDDVQYQSGEKSYFVGNLAVRQSQLRYFSMADSKPESWTSEILLRTALGIVAQREAVDLVTGLPLDFYFHQKSGFENLLSNFDPQPYKIFVGGKAMTCFPRISRYKIIPQGLGAAMDYLLDSGGKIVHPETSGGRVLVLDVGYYTFGKLILDHMEIDPASSSPALGVSEAYKMIQSDLHEQGRLIDGTDLDRAILGGKYTALRDKAFRTLARRYDMEIAGLNSTFDRYIICGGWAPQLAEYLTLPRGNTVVLDGLANVRGYYKAGVRLWGASACVPAKTMIS